MKDGRVLYCWIYFNPTVDTFGKQFHKSFTGYKAEPIKFIEYPIAPDPIVEEKSIFDDDDDDFNIYDEGPVCINCFGDLEYDFFNNYFCKCCGEWFPENDVLKFGQIK
jgi:hypothetical protein